MNRQNAAQLVGQCLTFRKNNLLHQDDHSTIYEWRKGEACKVVGFMEFIEGEPHLLVSHGYRQTDTGEGFHLAEIPLTKVKKELDLDGSKFSATRLATADRRQASFESLTVN